VRPAFLVTRRLGGSSSRELKNQKLLQCNYDNDGRRLKSIIIVFPDATTTSNAYLPLQLEVECVTENLQVRYPTASNIILLSDTFLPMMGLLFKKNLQFSELNGIIILHLTVICYKSAFETRRQFPMEEIANFHCIDHIIRWYIMKVAMAPFNLNEKENQALSLEAFQVLDSLKLKGGSGFIKNLT